MGSSHAAAREAVYGHAPQMYGTRQGQTEHQSYIGEHYNNADHAENQYNHHATYEKYVLRALLPLDPS